MLTKKKKKNPRILNIRRVYKRQMCQVFTITETPVGKERKRGGKKKTVRRRGEGEEVHRYVF